MNVADAIQGKRAIRQFQARPLPDEVVRAIINAGRLAGSAKNMQPWSFVVVREKATLAKLATCGEWCGHMAGAAMVVALVTPDPFQRLSVPFDLGRASQNMMLAAWEHGVGSVMATVYRADSARGTLGLPQGHIVPWCISFGYPAEDPSARAPRKAGRRLFEDVVHWEKW